MSAFAFRETPWQKLGAAPPSALAAPRETLHHAAQLLALAAVSFIPAEPDDSHTSLSWLAAHTGLATQPIAEPTPIRLALRVPDLALLTVDVASDEERDSLALDGVTRAEGLGWIGDRLGEAGLDVSRLRSTLHFTIAPHSTDSGGAFHAERADLEELGRWYADASSFLEQYRSSTAGAEPVRCWPHHFDIATLVRLPPGAGRLRTIGVGLSPGDEDCDQPYFYVGPYPSPQTVLPPLSIGAWHTTSWWGAVLDAGTIIGSGDADAQRALVEGFVSEAVDRLLASDGRSD